MLIEDNLRYKINELISEIKSSVGDSDIVRVHGSTPNVLKERSGRYRDVDLKWSREEVKYGTSKGMKYSTSFNVNNKKYNITVTGRITERGVEGAEVIFALDEHKGKNNVTSLTGTGDSFRVMSTILNALIKLANDRKEIQSVWWASTDSNKNPLFKRLSKMVPDGLDFECSYSSKTTGSYEKMTFTRTSEKKDRIDIDIEVRINPDDIKSTYLKIISTIENIFAPEIYQYKCGFHPYIYSEKYTKDEIKRLKLDKKVQDRIYQMLDSGEESHAAIMALLCRELKLIWSKSDISRGYTEFKGERIDIEDATKIIGPDILILKQRRYRIQSKVSSDVMLDIIVKNKNNIDLKSIDHLKERFNTRFEETLFYAEYYKMFKLMKRFLNGIFLAGMYRKNYFSKSQYLYLKRCQEITYNHRDNTIINNNTAMDTIVKMYDNMVKLKIFKTYGRKN